MNFVEKYFLVLQNSGRVILIFSVNMSGSFQGYAQMMSSIGRRRDRDNIWSEGSGKSNPWGRSFKVKWLRLYDLPFHKTLHLRNPLNDYKPVKISRDCQVPFNWELYCFLFSLYDPGKLSIYFMTLSQLPFPGVISRYWSSTLWTPWW